MITGKEFAKLFSENEELDELIEKVYSEGIEAGYKYAQRGFTAPMIKTGVMRSAGFSPSMTSAIRSGSIGKVEGSMMGGYGKWNRNLVTQSNAGKLANMSHPEKMASKNANKLMGAINNPTSTPATRLGEFKYNKSRGIPNAGQRIMPTFGSNSTLRKPTFSY